MAFYDDFLNKALNRLGVIRRSELAAFLPPAAIFSGETWPGAEYNIYARWSEYELQKLAVTNPWVYSSINIIGREIGLGTIGVERRSTKEGEKWIPEIDHPFERIVEGKPNPYQGQFYTWLYQVMWLLVQGEAYWMNVPDRTGELRQLYPLPASRIVPVPDPTGERLFAGFAYTPVTGAAPQLLLPEQVCFHRFPNLFDYHRGMSPISAYLISLQLDTEARKFDLEDFKNGLTLKHLVSLRPEASERERQTAQADLKEGRLNGERYMVIRAGQIDVKALDGRRAENGEVRRLTREECNYIFGIPDGLRDANATEANANVGWATFKGSTIWPLMEMLSEDMTAQIVHRFYGEDLRAKFEDIRPENVELKLKQKDSKRRVQTYDEARADDGLDPHPDAEVGQAPYIIAPQVYLAKFKQPALPAAKDEPAQERPLVEKAFKANGFDDIDGDISEDNDTPPEVERYEAELAQLVGMASGGEMDRTNFEDEVRTLTAAVLLSLFLLGSGKEERELTEEDRQALNERIETDLASVPNLADDVYSGKFKPMDEGGGGWSIAARTALWAGFAAATYQMSKMFGADDRLLMWTWAPEARHCRSCKELNGQVRTAAEWRAADLYPGHPDKLECQGFCKCRWTVVKERPVAEPILGGNGRVG